jgi:UDP-glucuronate decarboxylase
MDELKIIKIEKKHMNKSELQKQTTEKTQEQLVAQDISEITERLAKFGPKIKGKTFIISGGAGFLGSWFCETALNMGAKVTCIDNLVASTKQNIDNFSENPNFTFIRKDIARAKLPKGADYVIHMASIASPPLYQARPLDTLNAAVFGSVNLLEYSKRNKVSGYLLTSTSEVYGNPPDDKIPTVEIYPGSVHSYGARSMYDESKRVEEAYCYAYRNEVPIRIARIFNTYGPKIDAKHPSQYGRALIKFVNQAVDNQPITVYNDGNVTRSFCYINDQIVGLYQLLLTDHVDGEVINIGSDNEMTIKKLTEKIKMISGSKSEIVLNSPPEYNLEHDPKRRKPDITKARNLLAFNPKISLDEGLKKTIDWTKAGRKTKT